ncbi:MULTISPECIES: hypothetical protein [Pedobacter]|uniref:Brp/Blh family beta-carotene 15,15'-monooxygenase n=1 Tax=Pedobacter heparinus (strain ATCC 13125 / DSM 2366 / CIP 104194 / JCM 7457 / NBRC 12017 / NCIMB 9290 / NRRL B-14731 / HIM 762-3) TaxID=485917 RepID=C6Y2K1_PEDHD|nr:MULTISPECIES: hypothetical protein [Pedobacter]ACU05211.1 hypothetical protein Phep_3013 [Pedobacter heparinus DSM 2366]MBB5439248.1 hypothetical protein [Pedobacter sp. AK017]
MNKQEEQLNALNDIRNIMDRSSRFISLSGLSGVFAGFTALLGAYLAHIEIADYVNGKYTYGQSDLNLEFSLIKIGLAVLIVALVGGLLLTLRQTKKKNLPFWDRTTKNLLINLAIPLISGGLFIIALLLVHPRSYGLIAPSCLVFYGLALINASKYTYSDIRFLGFCEVVLGLIAMFNIGYGLYFWATGFGFLHIFYGTIMYFKYERAK